MRSTYALKSLIFIKKAYFLKTASGWYVHYPIIIGFLWFDSQLQCCRHNPTIAARGKCPTLFTTKWTKLQASLQSVSHVSIILWFDYIKLSIILLLAPILLPTQFYNTPKFCNLPYFKNQALRLIVANAFLSSFEMSICRRKSHVYY